MPYKLLLADDSVTIQRVIELTFADEDVKVTAVGDGQLAIDHIQSDRPDIVLADVGMPKHDGYEVAAFIKNDPALEHIPVLLLTGAFEPVDEERARAVRCDGVLAKPFEPQLLISRVKELLENAAPRAGAIPEDAAQDSAPAADVPAGGQAPAEDEIDEDATVRMHTPPMLPPGAEPQLEIEALNLRPETPAAPEGSLDDYFDRLDAAFAHLTGGQPGRDAPIARPAPADPFAPVRAPAPWAQMASGATGSSTGAASGFGDEGGRLPAIFGPGPEDSALSTPADTLDESATFAEVPVPDAFAALLEAEREHGADVVHRGGAGAVSTVLLPGTAVTQTFVDDVARRVMERLGDTILRDVVARVVSTTAERLIREEIERIKSSV
jgi:CheY-like chemotaxis protein